MDTARKNVTEISQFARGRSKSGGAGRGPLDDCREISVLGLANALSESLQLVAGQLLPMAEKAVGLDLYHLYMDAMELARDRSGPLTDAFRDQFVWRFNRECRREDEAARAEGLSAELSLLEPDDLEESLAAGTLANAIFNACSEELFGLDKRMGLLINDPDLRRGDNPLGPEVIGAAVLEALEGQESPMKVRLLLVTLLSRHLPERVRDIYQDINRKLVERNVLPTIRVGLRRSGQSGRTAAPAAAEGTASPVAAAGQAPAGGGDLFSVLQQMMASAYAGMGVAGPAVVGAGLPGQAFIPGPAMPGEPGSAPAGVLPGLVPAGGAVMGGALAGLHPGTFIYALNQLQHGDAEGVAMAGIEPAMLGNGQVNVLRGLRVSNMAGMMSSMDAMTLDIVTMVFDYILDDARIPDAIKALIGRLQIPVLKVAMLDKSFFSQKSHPARRLLDELAEAAVGWDAAEGHEGGLYRKMDELVARVLGQFEDSLEVFETALTDLRAYLAEEKRAASEAAARSAQAIKARERAGLSRLVARDEVESALLGRPAPAVIHAFLSEQWVDLLAGIHQKVGTASDVWKGAVATMTDLVWSVGPKVNVEERKRLVELLPSLLKRLDEGVQCLGIAGAARDEFFSSLVRCHAEAVRAGLLDEGAAMPPVTAMAAEDDIPVLDQPAEFEPVEPVAETEAADPVLVDELASEMPIAEEIDIEPLEWSQEDAPPMATSPELARLKRGSWIAYRQDDGVEVRAKLSWVSPLKGIYLFTNRQGQRAMSINAEGLEAKLRAGEVRLLDAAPLMDRAVDSLMERLKRNAA